MTHYNKSRYTPRPRKSPVSPPDIPPPLPPPKSCSIAGCTQLAYKHGYCINHAHRFEVTGNPKGKMPPRRMKNAMCDEPGCWRPYAAAGKCFRHYNLIREQLKSGKLRGQ